MSYRVLCEVVESWVTECSANMLNVDLQSGYFSRDYLLCQHAKIEVTEYSVKCSIFDLQSALWAMGKLTYRVICKAYLAMFAEYSVSPPKLDLQSTL